MNELALFAGAGGGLLATTHLLGWRTVAAVEKDPYRREVLLRRQRDGLLDLFPIWDDIRTFDGTPFRGVVDVVTAGFPCQPHSVAGKKLGERDERNLWPETISAIRDVRPSFVLLENVPGLLTNGYVGSVFGDLAQGGFDAIWSVLGACHVGAPHRRHRVWIVAWRNISNSDKSRLERWIKGSVSKCSSEQSFGETCSPICNANGERQQIIRDFHTGGLFSARGWWVAEPDVGRVAHGMAHRVDRLAALGDGQVPAVVKLAWHILTGETDD